MASHHAARPRVLVVEDTLIVANEIARMLTESGCEVIGPIPTVQKAAQAAEDEQLDAALLDINLQNDVVYPAAEILMRRKIPLAFLTGYSRSSIPSRFADLPCLEKPFSADELLQVLEGVLGIGVKH